jgi:DNA helicase-2/ATP-dependent DNA helicase PcrA
MQLDTFQTAFVQHPIQKNECVVLSAVAGSGKTTCSVLKIKGIIESDLFTPEQILFITFSNKSARDLTKKYTKLTGLIAKPFMSTIHSFCINVLRRYTGVNATLLSEWNAILIMRDVLVDLGFDVKYGCDNKRDLTILARTAADMTHWYKSQVHCREDITEDSLQGFLYKDFDKYPGTDLTNEDWLRAFAGYEQRKRNIKQMDYSDLVYNLFVLLQEDPKLLAKVKEMFPVIFVDECQDLDQLLYEFIFLISGGNNLFLIGDKAQTIYGFRWACPYHMEFDHVSHRFPNVEEYALKYNYRSTANIVKVTNLTRQILNDEIESIPHRPETKGSVKIQRVANNKSEGRQIAKLIEGFIGEGFKYSDIAIVSRTNNYLKTVVEPMLGSANIPYKLQTKNRKKFFDKPLVQAYFDFISLIIHPDNNLLIVDLARHVKGVGDSTISKFRRMSYQGKSIFDVSWNPAENKKVVRIKNLYDIIIEMNEYHKPDSLIHILNCFEKCVAEFFPANFTTNKEVDLINKALSTMVFTYFNEFGITSLPEIFERVLLDFTEMDIGESKDSVDMLTVHGSKGLEYPIVISGDHGRWSIRDEDTFDEGCILHVALSRAIDKLVILHSDIYIDASFKERASQYTSVYLEFKQLAGY